MCMSNVNITKVSRLPSFRELAKSFPILEAAKQMILSAREAVTRVLYGSAPHPKSILIIVGPCSVHNTEEAYEYATRLAGLMKKVKSRITILMRVCGDKPRTRKDWEGFMKDPNLDGSCDMVSGFKKMRKLMLDIVNLGVPIATEALHRAAFNVISDLVSYTWIGARTIADPEKRAMASGLSMPVGMKNPDHGPLSIAINAIDYARHPGVFDGPDEDNVLSIIETAGNTDAHLILRGKKNSHAKESQKKVIPNFDSVSIKEACQELRKAKLIKRVIVDCSHDNCEGNYQNQVTVVDSLMEQIVSGETGIAGLMLESYLKGGQQDGKALGTPEGAEAVKPELSVTDACLSWEDTESLILGVYKKLGGK